MAWRLFRSVWMVSLALILFGMGLGCDSDSDDDGESSGLDGDWFIEDGDAEQPDYQDYEPSDQTQCTWNDCSANHVSEGAFCLENLTLDGDDGTGEAPVTLLTCGKDEDGCIVELSRETCTYGCDIDNDVCFPEPGHISGTITREATPASVVDGGATATLFHGKVWINVFNAPRNGLDIPENSIVAVARVMEVDLSDAQASVTFDEVLYDVAEQGASLSAGTYYVDAWLTAPDVENQETLSNGDLIQLTQQEVTADAEGNIEVTLHLDAAWDDAVLEP